MEQQILITRLLDAPPALVFKAWTDAEHLPRWFAPPGCTIVFHRLDIREGGTFLSCIHGPDDFECWCAGEYREITPERIVYTMVNTDEHGNPVDPASIGMDPAWPRETIVTVSILAHEGKTKLVLQQTVSEELAKRTGAHPSWLLMLDRLAEQLHVASTS